jgi:hypothetical protein
LSDPAGKNELTPIKAGGLEWTAQMAERLKIDLSPRTRGRPRKEK